MKKILITLMIGLLILAGCSKKQAEEAEKNFSVKDVDGIKVYSNKNEPSDKNLKVELKEVLAISGFEEGDPDERNIGVPMAVTADKNNNIYILDAASKSIKKFGPDGTFIRQITRQGTGPGEIRSANDINIMNDTLVVADFNGRKLAKFDLDGNHYFDTPVGGNRTPVLFQPFDDENSLGVVWYEGREGDEFWVSVSLSILDNRLNEVKVLDTQRKKFVPGSFNIADLIGSYTVSDDKLFINSPSPDKFYIKVFDHQGNEISGISKSYRRLMMSEKEIKQFNEGMKNAFGLNMETVKMAKRSMNGMYYDKYGRLWVLTSAERSAENEETFYADIFKDGVYLNRISVPQFKGSDYFDIGRQIYFIGEYIYLLNIASNEVKVFEY